MTYIFFLILKKHSQILLLHSESFHGYLTRSLTIVSGTKLLRNSLGYHQMSLTMAVSLDLPKAADFTFLVVSSQHFIFNDIVSSAVRINKKR